MQSFLTRAINIVFRPEAEWAAIALERDGWRRVLGYLVPLAVISPLAFSAGVLLGGEGALRRFADDEATLRFALLASVGGFSATLLSVATITIVIRVLVPLYPGSCKLTDAFRVAVYAGTPVWLAGLVLVAPLQRFPLLVIIVLIGLMHASYLFYLGLHHVAKVPRGDAAECAAVVIIASLVLSTVVGYLGSAAGLFAHM